LGGAGKEGKKRCLGSLDSLVANRGVTCLKGGLNPRMLIGESQPACGASCPGKGRTITKWIEKQEVMSPAGGKNYSASPELR